MTINDSLMILSTRFDDTGDWTVEQQFVLQMGSSYLMAHGIGEPLNKDAHTSFEVPDDGDYTLWVRTKNWTAFWSEGLTPGRFQVILDGRPDPAEFGIGKDGDKSDTSREARATRAAWYWQKGGTYALSKGAGRCVISSSNRDLLAAYRAKGGKELIHLIFAKTDDIDWLVSLGNAALAFNYPDLSQEVHLQHGNIHIDSLKELVDHCHAMGLKICFRAVDTPEAERQSAALGIDYFPTNNLWPGRGQKTTHL